MIVRVDFVGKYLHFKTRESERNETMDSVKGNRNSFASFQIEEDMGLVMVLRFKANLHLGLEKDYRMGRY